MCRLIKNRHLSKPSRATELIVSALSISVGLPIHKHGPYRSFLSIFLVLSLSLLPLSLSIACSGGPEETSTVAQLADGWRQCPSLRRIRWEGRRQAAAQKERQRVAGGGGALPSTGSGRRGGGGRRRLQRPPLSQI